jgi:hypothetical protein
MPVSDGDKKKLIVNEIESWRRSKLLPEQYCDFLQNLYLDDLEDRPKNLVGRAVRKIEQASRRQWLLGFGIFTLICLVVLYFNAFPLALQIGLAAAATAGLVAGGARWRDRLPHRAFLLLGTGMLLLLLSGMAILHLHGWEKGAGPVLLLIVCALTWIGVGVALRFGLLQWCGWMAVVVLYAWTLAHKINEPNGIEVQLFWLPAAVLFVWLSWFVSVKIRSAGTVLFATAIVLWFMPELYSALYGIDTQWIPFQLLAKIAIAGISLYKWRKHWMEWVA